MPGIVVPLPWDHPLLQFDPLPGVLATRAESEACVLVHYIGGLPKDVTRIIAMKVKAHQRWAKVKKFITISTVCGYWQYEYDAWELHFSG